MRCPFCHADDDKVIDSRSVEDGLNIRRRRVCNACGRRFTTYERVEETPLRVQKKDGSAEPFMREKIRTGIERATWRRPVSAEDIERIVQRVEARALENPNRDVPSTLIGSLILKELRRIDPVAYVRFSSVYKDFKDVSEFRKVLDEFERGEDEDNEGENS